jgi:ACS family glucarate transporter-like MFS transporter
VNEGERRLLEACAGNAESHGEIDASALKGVGTLFLAVVGTLAATLLFAPKIYPYLFLCMVIFGGAIAHFWGRKNRGTIWGEMLCSRSVWLLWVQYFLLSFPWYFYITWLPTYLQDYRKLSPADSAYYAILPLFLGGTGSLFCGFLSPKLAQMMGSVKTARRSIASVGFLGAGLMLIVSIQTQDPLYAMIFMGLASFFNDLVMPGAWAACMDVGGKYAGTLAGSMNMMGNMAGFTAPLIGGFILDSTKASTGTSDWNQFLYLMAGVYLLGTVVWPFIDPVTPLEEKL